MAERFPRRRVVVTGIGTATAAGYAKQFSSDSPLTVVDGDFWPNVISGRSFVGQVQIGQGTNHETTEIGGEVPNFSRVLREYVHPGQIKNTPTHGLFSLVAGLQAGLDSGLLEVVQRAGDKQEAIYALCRSLTPERFALKVAIAVGGDKAIEEAVRTLMTRGNSDRVSGRTIPLLNPNNSTAPLARLIGVRDRKTDEIDPEQALFLDGDSPTFACTSGARGIWDVYKSIAYGEADAGLAGGTEDPLHPVPYAGFHKAGHHGVLAKFDHFSDDPSRSSRPFDLDRQGLVPGQGAGVVALESLSHALDRGAKIYAEVAGGWFGMNANHTLDPTPKAEVTVMTRALESARLTPRVLDYINAHAAGTTGDTTEDRAVKILMGAYLDQLAMSSSKSIFGHLMGAAGAVEAIATIKAIESGILPPTVNLDHPEDPEIDHVAKEARARSIRVALSNSFGLEGTYGSLVFVRYPDWESLR